MLSYRHSFHAGNHGDVLKHWALVTMLDYLNRKDKPYWYIDTHAGAGQYDMDSAHSRKIQEHRYGIDKVMAAGDLPESLQRYRNLVTRLGRAEQGTGLKSYPGSPAIALALTRSMDKLRFYEMHSSDSRKLQKYLQGQERAKLEVADGFAGLKALLPPPTKRALVMIDPSYEVKADYTTVLRALPDAVRRFEVGVYGVWYPLLSLLDNVNFQERLHKLDGFKWMDIRLWADSRPNAPGMFGS
ncbi:MAG: 23S rRNA (adenine(2030)-N(6))-methyltransferase RlmJ, partial [Ketobacteraceae bacterium]|nr:23S rRNA (adenine(2030)-N(6))-methyltransferase RlmJ [Ketobacteraceae bacterium]